MAPSTFHGSVIQGPVLIRQQQKTAKSGRSGLSSIGDY
jgi:hypothetical protein